MTEEHIVIDDDGHGDIKELYAYISQDENGKSGICAGTTVIGLTPFVGSRLEDMDKWQSMVKELREETNKSIFLVRYELADILG